jgi:hypothetical protein
MRILFVLLLVLPFAFSSHGQFWKKDDKSDKKEKKEKRSKQDLNSMYSLMYQGDLSADFGANHLLSDHQAISRLQNRFIPANIFKKDNTISKIGNSLYRLSKTFLIDYTMNYSIYSTQRFVFGSKYRLDQSGGTNTQVNLKLPPPYTDDFSTVVSTFTDSISSFQQSLNIAAAMEGSSVLSDLARKNTLINQDFAYEDALLYLFTNNDLAAHIGLIKDNGYNEIYGYVNQINTMYADANLTVQKLKVLSFLDMGLDPMNIASVVGIAKYIVKGEELTDMLWLKFGEKIKWLPSLKMNLAPFGPQLNYQNFLKIDKAMFEFDFHHAVGGYVKSMGVDIKAFNLLFGEKKKLAIDGMMSFWNQPEISFKKDALFESFEGFSGGGQVNINYRILKKRNAYVQGTIGYKGKGYQEGASLDSDFIFRFGLAFR